MYIHPSPTVPDEKPFRPLEAVIGESAKAARLRARLTQAQVADRAQLAISVYNRLERGRMRPSVGTLYRLCAALGSSPNELLGFPNTLPTADISTSSARRELLHRMRQLDEPQAHALLRFLQVLR